MTRLGLSADEVLTTTRAVRRRLDLGRPVPRALIEECLQIALQAPTGSNRQLWHFVVVTEPATKAALADVYRRGAERYVHEVGDQGRIEPADPERYEASTARVHDAADHLRAVMQDVPGLFVPCVRGRMEGRPAVAWSSQLGSVIQATWSFMLAARERGIGTCWTTVHLALEQEAAAILGIPYEEVTQVALIPYAFTRGTDFRPARREPLDLVVHWERW